MFSNILKIQAFFEKFKKNKGLFFTTLTTGSIVVIALALFYLNTVAQRTASTFYNQERVDVMKFVDDQLISKSEKLIPISILVATNENIVKNLQDIVLPPPKPQPTLADLATQDNTTDTNATEINATTTIQATISTDELKEQLATIIKKSNSDISAYSTSNIDIALYDRDTRLVADAITGASKNSSEQSTRASIIQAVATGETIVGLEQLGVDTILRAITPVKSGTGELLGVLEVRQDVGFLQKALNDQGYDFIFALDRFTFSNEYMRNLPTREIDERYVTVQRDVNSKFFEFLKDVDYKELIEDEYILDSDFFVTYKMVQDVEGVNFGVMLIGESMDKPSNVLEVVDSVAKNITTVALGLVVALLILMI